MIAIGVDVEAEVECGVVECSGDIHIDQDF